VLPDDSSATVVDGVVAAARSCGFDVRHTIESPIRGHGGNREFFLHLIPVDEQAGNLTGPT